MLILVVVYTNMKTVCEILVLTIVAIHVYSLVWGPTLSHYPSLVLVECCECSFYNGVNRNSSGY